MMQRRSFLAFAAAALAACGPVTVTPETDASPPVAPVEATFLSASLSDDCRASEAPSAGDCAASADAGAGLVGGCGFCRQSNMQLRFVSPAGRPPARVEVVTVRLLDAASNAPLDTLTAREPSSWDAAASQYRPWDAVVPSGQTVQASWKLSAPRWDAVASGRLAYQRRLRLEVVLRIDGAERTLRSGELTREPEVVT